MSTAVVRGGKLKQRWLCPSAHIPIVMAWSTPSGLEFPQDVQDILISLAKVEMDNTIALSFLLAEQGGIWVMLTSGTVHISTIKKSRNGVGDPC